MSATADERSEQYWFARHSKSIIFLICILAVIGVYEAFTLPVAVFPTTNFPRIIIGVDNGVTPIEQMEVTITRPLEEAVRTVPGLQDVRSVTSRGSAEINLFFDWSVDMLETLQLVDAAVSRVQRTLPPTAQIRTHRLDFSSFPIIGYSLTSDTVPQTDLWELATYEIKPRLNRLPGVASILIQGGQRPEFHAIVDPAQMLRARTSIADIVGAVNRTNVIDSPGLLNRNHQLFLGLVDAQVHSVDDIGNIVVKRNNNVPVRIRDVATVTPATEPIYTAVSANGKPALLLSVNRQPDSNTVQVADEVHQEMAAIRSSLPSGVEMRPFYDQSDIVTQSIGSVRDAIIVGLFLAGLIIWLFLRDWGTAVMTGLVVPVTMVVTFIVMKLLGQSFNLMTLGGLAAAVGLVIDDKIVVVENIVLHRDGGEGPLQATASALKELTVPLIGSTLTPIVVFLPLITITGVTGTFFGALAIAMSVSLLTSLVLALVWTSNLSIRLVRRHGAAAPATLHSDPAHRLPRGFETDPHAAQMRRMMAAEEASLTGGLFGRVLVGYERALRQSLHHRLALAALCAVLVVVSYACYKFLGSDLLPAFDEGGFVLDYVMPPGSSLQETGRVIGRIERILRATPEVESTSRRTGLELGLAAVTEPNTGDIAVKLKADRKRSVEEVISDVRAKVVSSEPGLDVEFIQVLQDMIGDLTGAPEPVVVKLFSPDPELLSTWAPQVADALEKVKIGGGTPIVDVENGIEKTTSGPAVRFLVNPDAADRAGFTAEELGTVGVAMVEGEPTQAPVLINDKPYPLRVRFPASARSSLEAMSNTMLVSSSGSTATLGSMTTIDELPGQTEVRRENLQRLVEVTARLEGVDMGTGIAAVQKTVADLKLPPSIRVEYGGTFKEQQKSFRDLTTVLVLAVVLIFLVLLFEFRSFTPPLAILSSALLSTSGVFVALLLTRTSFNVSSFMGLIMVIGIVAKNGILLLDANDKFRDVGFSPEEAIVQAGRRRLRPIVMTAIAAAAGMLPLALGIGAGSQMLQPLAIAVIGGILISMVLSLIVTPAIQFFFTARSAERVAV
ncbi:MAG TPA: efflux RND transporter permease subunit [Vicinamibacterales bacterium]|nr:efflux RND transporter permease subunit [Vicinamibacterales bacterium]